MPEFIPLYDGVLIIPEKIEDTTKGGLIIPSLVKTNSTIVHGHIHVAGPNAPEHLKKGFRVIYNKGACVTIPLNETQYHFTKSANIYCVAEE